jgi:L-ascorbate metabolism protein UlaG (beta-lactamase superfamily)
MKYRDLICFRNGQPNLTQSLASWLIPALIVAASFAATACVQGRPQNVDLGQTSPSADTATEIGVRYLANEGFLVEGGGRRILVDGLFGAGISGYPAVPPQVRSRLENGVDEWSNIQVAIATHHHGDHFDPDSVARFLEANPKAVFVSTPQAIDRLTAHLAGQWTSPASIQTDLLARLRAVLPAEGSTERLEVAGIGIEVLNLHHGRRDPPVQNLGLVVTLGDQRFLHFGDTEAKMEEFEPYLDLLRDTDLALLPFWFLSSEWRAQMVRDLIQPHRIVVAHLPMPDADASYFGRWNSYDNLVRSITTAFPDARFPDQPGESLRLGGD